MNDTTRNTESLAMAAEVVAAFVSHNSLPPGELPALLQSVHASFGEIAAGKTIEPAQEAKKPAVPIKRSVTNDFIICLEDGRKFKSLKRHLSTAFGLSPDEYRDKWGLRSDYPMVAPAYASARSALAKEMGLGQKRKAKARPIQAAVKKPRRRSKAAVNKPRGRSKAAA